MALSLKGRALHFVFKIGDRKASIDFFKDILGMKVLRHEEFSEGCEATCNGLYQGRWSKTMIGYGPEDNHFVLELTYNYGVKTYDPGNDYLYITIRSSDAVKKARAKKMELEKTDEGFLIKSPSGYKFLLIDQPSPMDPVEKVTLASSNLEKTIQYWNGVLGLKMIHRKNKSASFAFDENQCKLEFEDIKTPINHAQAYGRIAFSVPHSSLQSIQNKIEHEKLTILTPLIDLDTPDKATVTVVILADPDGHEICFVNDEGFRDLSKVDPNAQAALNKFIKSDRS